MNGFAALDSKTAQCCVVGKGQRTEFAVAMKHDVIWACAMFTEFWTVFCLTFWGQFRCRRLLLFCDLIDQAGEGNEDYNQLKQIIISNYAHIDHPPPKRTGGKKCHPLRRGKPPARLAAPVSCRNRVDCIKYHTVCQMFRRSYFFALRSAVGARIRLREEADE